MIIFPGFSEQQNKEILENEAGALYENAIGRMKSDFLFSTSLGQDILKKCVDTSTSDEIKIVLHIAKSRKIREVPPATALLADCYAHIERFIKQAICTDRSKSQQVSVTSTDYTPNKQALCYVTGFLLRRVKKKQWD